MQKQQRPHHHGMGLFQKPLDSHRMQKDALETALRATADAGSFTMVPLDQLSINSRNLLPNSTSTEDPGPKSNLPDTHAALEDVHRLSDKLNEVRVACPTTAAVSVSAADVPAQQRDNSSNLLDNSSNLLDEAKSTLPGVWRYTGADTPVAKVKPSSSIVPPGMANTSPGLPGSVIRFGGHRRACIHQWIGLDTVDDQLAPEPNDGVLTGEYAYGQGYPDLATPVETLLGKSKHGAHSNRRTSSTASTGGSSKPPRRIARTEADGHFMQSASAVQLLIDGAVVDPEDTVVSSTEAAVAAVDSMQSSQELAVAAAAAEAHTGRNDQQSSFTADIGAHSQVVQLDNTVELLLGSTTAAANQHPSSRPATVAQTAASAVAPVSPTAAALAAETTGTAVCNTDTPPAAPAATPAASSAAAPAAQISEAIQTSTGTASAAAAAVPAMTPYAADADAATVAWQVWQNVAGNSTAPSPSLLPLPAALRLPQAGPAAANAETVFPTAAAATAAGVGSGAVDVFSTSSLTPASPEPAGFRSAAAAAAGSSDTSVSATIETGAPIPTPATAASQVLRSPCTLLQQLLSSSSGSNGSSVLQPVLQAVVPFIGKACGEGSITVVAGPQVANNSSNSNSSSIVVTSGVTATFEVWDTVHDMVGDLGLTQQQMQQAMEALAGVEEKLRLLAAPTDGAAAANRAGAPASAIEVFTAQAVYCILQKDFGRRLKKAKQS